MKTVKKITERIKEIEKQIAIESDPERRNDLNEELENLGYDLDELQAAENEQASWEEMTGTTPQDLYIEHNSYAIAQSERYEQFRNEY